MAANGIAFRATSTFVTDGAGDTYSLGAAYPETRSGETFGWGVDSTGNARDRDTFRPKLAGIVFHANGSGTRYFRWDKPAGTYTVRVALGDATNLQNQKLVIRDGVGGSVLATITGSTGVVEFIDASGVVRSGTDGVIQSIWERDNVSVSLTQASGAFVFEIGDTAGTLASTLSYVSVVGSASGPTLSAPTKSDTATTATGGFTTNGTDGTALMVWTRSATQPTIAQVKAGQDHTGGTSGVVVPSALTITSSGAKSFGAATVTTGLTYWGYVVHTNAAGGDSAVLPLGPVYPGTGRPVSDTLVTGWTVTGAATHAAALNEDSASDAEYVTSPTLSSTPVKERLALDKTYPAGTYPVKVRAGMSSGTGTLRVRLTDAGGTQQGVTADQALTTTMTLFQPNITTTGPATHIEIEITSP